MKGRFLDVILVGLGIFACLVLVISLMLILLSECPHWSAGNCQIEIADHTLH